MTLILFFKCCYYLQILTDTNYIVANHTYFSLAKFTTLLKNMSSFQSQLTKKLVFSKKNKLVHKTVTLKFFKKFLYISFYRKMDIKSKSKNEVDLFLSKLSKRYASLFPGCTKTALSILTNLEKNLYFSDKNKSLFDCLKEDSTSSRGKFFL